MINTPNKHVFGLREETGEPGENLQPSTFNSLKSGLIREIINQSHSHLGKPDAAAAAAGYEVLS